MDILSYSLCFSLIIWISFKALYSILSTRLKRNSSTINLPLPPGPKPFPIIGNLLELGDKPHKSLAKLSALYGPIIRLQLGQVTTVVVSSAATAKQVLHTRDQSFANRSIPDALRACRQGDYGLPWIPANPRWRELRKICNLHLFSAKVLDSSQNLRREKVEKLLADVQKRMMSREAVYIGRAAFRTSLNLLSTTVFSQDLADGGGGGGGGRGSAGAASTARELKEIVWNIMEDVGKPNLADYFPILKRIDPHGIRRRTEVHFGKMLSLFDELIDERLSLRKSGESCHSDLLDVLINISEEDGDEIMDKSKMKHLFVDLFVAGTETTSTTLEWSMAEVLNNPKILAKSQSELHQVIGRGNQINESDIARLPYLQAIVKETLRLHPAVPLLLPRKAEADTEVEGCVVPKGAQLLVNVWAIGRDASSWDNPQEFDPERFLGSDVDFRGRDFGLAPFGGGRRICPGLPLATRMLHLILGSLIHSFDWELEREGLNMEDKFGLTLQMAQPLRAFPKPLA